jgi:hypothetical protein
MECSAGGVPNIAGRNTKINRIKAVRIFSAIKNIPGYRTSQKKLAFSVDDFGNIFLHSKAARESLRKAGLPVDESRFSQWDILENQNDLTGLFEVLSSVKDLHGQSACFTAFTNCANIDFDTIENTNFTGYHYQSLPDTLSSLPGYEGTWESWQEGIKNKLLVPEFHGREHLSVLFLEKGMEQKDARILLNLKERSWAALGYFGRIGFTEAFSFNHISETERHKEIIADGLDLFEKVFGRKAFHFNAPGAREHRSVHDTIKAKGVQLIDADFFRKEFQGNGAYKKMYNSFGSSNKAGLITVFRNCVFEPSLQERTDWVDSCMKEIELAFMLGKPANISSHRVNFVGGIEPSIRDLGLKELKRLLTAIIKKWPDVEFVAAPDLLGK